MYLQTTDKLLWMQKSLKAEWKKEKSSEYKWLVKVASKAIEFGVEKVMPAAVPAGLLNKAAKEIAGQAGKLLPCGHGLFDRAALQMSAREKKSLENKQAFWRAVGESTFLFVWAAATGSVPVLGGIVLATAGLKYLIKAKDLASEKRWEEITASMMAKYEAILLKAEKKLLKAVEVEEGVQDMRDLQVRLEYHNEEEVILYEIKVKRSNGEYRTVRLTPGGLVRLHLYLDFYLSKPVVQGMYPIKVMGKVYATLYKDVEQYSANSLGFENDEAHDRDFREKQRGKVDDILSTHVD